MKNQLNLVKTKGLGFIHLVLCSVLLAIAAQACSQTFEFKPGSHYPSPKKFVPHFGGVEAQTYLVTFDSGCVYHFDNEDSADINKLFGWSTGWGSHSIRMGWNCRSETGIDLWAYFHYNGKRWIVPKDSSSNKKSASLIGKGFATGLPISCGIYRSRDGIEFEAIQGARIERLKIKFANFPGGWGAYQWPYFGGTSTAPHRMTIILAPRY